MNSHSQEVDSLHGTAMEGDTGLKFSAATPLRMRINNQFWGVCHIKNKGERSFLLDQNYSEAEWIQNRPTFKEPDSRHNLDLMEKSVEQNMTL